MNRREALKKLGIVVGGTVVGSQVLLMGCSSGRRDLSKTFSPENLKLLNEVGETIIPATKTAGAKAANVADFMKTIVTVFYTEEEQRVFAEGVIALNELADKNYGGSFTELSEKNKHDLLLGLEGAAAGEEGNSHYYIMLKQLIIWGFLTSEVAANKVFIHTPVPGYFDGCVEFKPGDKALFPRANQWQAMDFAKH